MANLSSDLRDRLLRHEIALRGYTNATVRKILGMLNEAEADIVKQIERRLAWIAERGYDASDFTLKRLEANLREVREVTKQAYRRIGKEVLSELEKLAKVEAGFVSDALASGLQSVGVSLGVGIAEGVLLKAIVNKRPFQGGLLRDWVAKLERDQFQRVSGAVRQGMLQGESIDKIVRRIRGTKAGKFKDGILSIARRDAEAVVRTAVSHVANGARDETWAENADLIKAVVWESTLDGRTTELCQVRDGLRYSLPDHKPLGHSIPWGAGPGRLHWQCRSSSFPELASWRELGIDADEVTGEQRSALDGFVPGDTTYGEWIKRQPVAVQDRALGKRRAQLMRAGEVEFAEFFDRRGNLLTLEELRGTE